MDYNLVIFISGTWPGQNKGYELANLSTLSYFSSRVKKCLYFAPEDEHLTDNISYQFSDCTFHPVDFSRKPKIFRFLKSLFSNYPAITERFWGKGEQIISIIEREKNQPDEKILFFYEDIPSSFLLLELKKRFAKSTHIIRSHNVVYKGFLGLSKRKNPLSNLAWNHELKKIKRFEEKVYQQSDKFYAISGDDLSYYEKKMQVKCSGIIGFYLDDSYFYKDTTAEKNNILFLGTADLRKGQALKLFIKECWSHIHDQMPGVKLLIGGKNTQSFHNPASNIHAYGFIEDERSFLKKGSVFINPQNDGAGIKIKSVVALAASKALVTTSTGAEGIGLIPGIHCIIEDDFKKQASAIIKMLKNANLRDDIATNGRDYVQTNFSKNTFFEKMDDLFNYHH